ncbi:hypothetical protein IGB42_00034 [Andreprevotia sp. IGB-42]|uniref:hypothetical protein n=1 Tax=Andreprevotia sp. IGB-42 TaxID=2497473 RepID=UPI00135B62C1|nr:hypothetical protein [Andreprevotia sp. IGB-42]KAF0814958.1 hypothetical protein IGB42_00034 [Andreprevotia sp. IGB-42]
MIVLSTALFIGAVVVLFYYFVRMPAALKDWERLPTKETYLALHPDARHAKGGRCHQCMNEALLNVGLMRMTDYRRKRFCKPCKLSLWRETV